MNMIMIINMFTRLMTRRLMNWGINKGLGTVSRARKPKRASLPPQVDQAGNPLPPQPKPAGGAGHNRKQAADLARKLRMVNRMTRR